MSRLIDMVMDHIKDDSNPMVGLGYRPPSDPPLSAEERTRVEKVKGMLREAAVFEATNVSDWYWYQSRQALWEEIDFPGMVPPYPITWIEHRRPREIFKPGLTEAPEKYMARQYGFLWVRVDHDLEGFTPTLLKWCPGATAPEAARWLVLGMLFESDPVDGTEVVCMDSHRICVYLDDSGNVQKWFMPDLIEAENRVIDPEKRFYLPMDFRHVAFSSMLTMSLLNCSNLPRREHKHPPALQKARRRRGRPPLRSYATIDIDFLKPLHAKSAGQATGKQLKPHLVRGHPKQYGKGGKGLLFGKVAGQIWFQQHARGVHAADDAPKVKDYKVKPLKPPDQ